MAELKTREFVEMKAKVAKLLPLHSVFVSCDGICKYTHDNFSNWIGIRECSLSLRGQHQFCGVKEVRHSRPVIRCIMIEIL
jgi:hypothetical protein